MPRKPKTSAPKGAAWDPDIYDTSAFVHGLDNLNASVTVPPSVVSELAGLAGAKDREAFERGINFSVVTAHTDFPLLSSTVYRGELIARIAEVEGAANDLRVKLQAIQNPATRTSLWVGRAVRDELVSRAREIGAEKSEAETHPLERSNPFMQNLEALSEAARKAKASSLYVDFARKKGPPSGAGQSGIALTRFIAHLAFAALAGGGSWTLDKNGESGTLTDAIERLRHFLPCDFLPAADTNIHIHRTRKF
jgi:hypothetical protein